VLSKSCSREIRAPLGQNHIDSGEVKASTMSTREVYPQCGSTWYKRNGHIHTGKQNHRYNVCSRAFVLVPENHLLTDEQRALVERLLLERRSLRGICRVVGVGLRWLLRFMVERFSEAPDHLNIKPPVGTPAVILHRLEAELDELWSFVGNKAKRHWIWIALDATTRQVLAFHVGDRSSQSAQRPPSAVRPQPLPSMFTQNRKRGRVRSRP
jgi:insertion element IS1 protein InsB